MAKESQSESATTAQAAQLGRDTGRLPAQPSSRSLLRRLKAPLTLAAIGLAAGLLAAAGWLLAPPSSPIPSDPPAGPDRPAARPDSLVELDLAAKTPEDLAPLTVTIQEGDRLLLAGQPGAALRAYRVLVDAQPQPSAELRFRVAVCRELLGDTASALDTYRALASDGRRPHLVRAAELRQVHTLLQLTRPGLAKQILWRRILDPLALAVSTQSAQGEVLHTLAQVLTAEATRDVKDSLLADTGIVYPTLEMSVEQILAMLNREQWPAPTPLTEPHFVSHPDEESTQVAGPSLPQPAAAGVVLKQQIGTRPDEIFLSVQLPTISLAGLLERVSQETGQSIQWTSLARDEATNHTVTANVADISLAMLLDALLDPHNLAWQHVDANLNIIAIEELPNDAVRQLRITTSERALQQALVNFPDHPLVDEAYWSLGNLAFVRDEISLAQIHYQQHLRQFPRAAGRAAVHFNSAKAYLNLDRSDAARQDFYYVVDSGSTDPLAPLAYLFLGRLYLENDEARRAIKPLTRAVALARDPEQSATAVLATAAAYLLDGKPHAANRTLMEFRDSLRQPASADQAAFLAALARLRAAKFETQIEQEARALVNALSHVDPGTIFGAHGYLLTAEACRDLELSQLTRDVLVRGVAAAPAGALRDRLTFELAQLYEQSGEVSEARDIYRAIAEQGLEPWKSRGELRQAQLALAARDPAAALAACQRLLTRSAQTESIEEILRTLGHVYQQQGDFEKAAQCFAGVAPDLIPAPSPPVGDPHAAEEMGTPRRFPPSEQP